MELAYIVIILLLTACFGVSTFWHTVTKRHLRESLVRWDRMFKERNDALQKLDSVSQELFLTSHELAMERKFPTDSSASLSADQE